jgi:pyruvate/2-oxoglutarate dehydrogenase complex dihydrolipoamide dehydrogenase (E3) component
MSENKARKQGRNIRVAKLPMIAVARALEIGEARGFMKAVVNAETQHILGCAMLCAEGGDDGQAALHRLKRGQLHASNPG